MPRKPFSEVTVGMAIASVFWVIVIIWISAPAILVEICEQAKNAGEKKCNAYGLIHFLQIAFFKFLNDNATLITAVATGFIARFTWTLRKSTDNLWRISQTQFFAANRPRIRFKHVLLVSPLVSNKPITVRVVCVNNGVLKGTIFEYGIDAFVVNRGNILPRPDFEGKAKSLLVDLPSGISLQLPDENFTINPAEEIHVRRGDGKLCCVGYLHYRDEEGRIRTSAFGRELVMPDGARVLGGRRFIRIDDTDYEYED